MFAQTDPQTLRRWLIVGAVVYVLLPFDVVPDVLGVPGRVDDLLAISLLVWFYRNHVRQYTANRFGQDPPAQSERVTTFDPYEVLQVPRSASRDTIHAAYIERMKEYHPDKVAHLGQELQKLAHEKSQEIQRAYHQLSE